jgi:hypothetical protein
MTTIPLALIKSTWIRFCKESPEHRQTLINDFCKRQPYVYEFVESQDKKWFPNKSATIRMMALFVWLVFMSASRGNVPTVTREHMAEFLQKGIELIDTLDEESEFKATELGVKNLMSHPQIELSMFLFDYLTHKEDCPELTPTSTKAAHSHIDTVIRAFDAAVSRQPRTR